MAFYEMEYIYNGLNYNIVDSLEVHEKLKNDDAFFQAYMKNNLNSLEVAGSNNDTFTENCSGHIANNILDSEESNKQQWTVKLLQNYYWNCTRREKKNSVIPKSRKETCGHRL
ncbi:uncharacterized protein LOC105181132 [Harpegnathos saltator]|uniref:uncharacterized protein LOC105181132 n=1 Tax=Harpegnathos saltator TaxID=610380 RepID=UPI00058FD69F|nr:uncharacterized protein LOC105181132 [Harpegnathos saltator]